MADWPKVRIIILKSYDWPDMIEYLESMIKNVPLRKWRRVKSFSGIIKKRF